MKNDKKKYFVMILNIIIMICNFLVGNFDTSDNTKTDQSVLRVVDE